MDAALGGGVGGAHCEFGAPPATMRPHSILESLHPQERWLGSGPEPHLTGSDGQRSRNAVGLLH
jgi:hypothetical protein